MISIHRLIEINVLLALLFIHPRLYKMRDIVYSHISRDARGFMFIVYLVIYFTKYKEAKLEKYCNIIFSCI